MKKISIVIPTLNEQEYIGKLLSYLLKQTANKQVEIIVADGGSSDRTIEIATGLGAIVLNCAKGRAVQMNQAAMQANGQILYFVHADTIPPPNFYAQINKKVEEGSKIGCFRFKFDSTHYLLKINSFFTRFPFSWCRGGDQTLYITRSFFDELNGFDERFIIMEEYDLIRRAKKSTAFDILSDDVLVSARKYNENGYLRVQIANFVVFNMFRLGFSQEKMISTYRKILNVRGLSWSV